MVKQKRGTTMLVAAQSTVQHKFTKPRRRDDGKLHSYKLEEIHQPKQSRR